MDSNLQEEKFTDTDQVSPNAEEYVPKTISLIRKKRSKKEQEKQDERQRQLERDARKQETLTED